VQAKPDQFRTHQFELVRGFSAQLGRRRKRRGLVQPPRFLVLAPMRPGETFRHTLCAGDYRYGRAELDYGMISSELRDLLEAGCARVLDEVS
jgi:hypothetical protein